MADGNPFQRRTGFAQFPRWRGVNKQGRASLINPDELRDAINVRLTDGGIDNRGGQSKLGANTVTGCVFGIYENVQQWYGVKFYILTQDSVDANLKSYSQEDTPNFQDITTTGGYVYFNGGMVAYQDVLHYAGVTSINKLEQVPTLPGQDTSDVGGLKRGVQLALIPGSVSATSLAVMRPTLASDESVFVGTSSGGHVFRWDGTSIIQDTTSALGSSNQVLGTYREDLLVFGTHYANRRNGGAYTTITMPGGMTSFEPFDTAVYKDILYIAGRDNSAGPIYRPKILAWNGTSLTVVNSPSDVGSVHEGDEGVRSLAVFNGFLFYGWRDMNVGSGAGMLGRFDGSSWVDTHKNLFTQFSNTATFSLQSTPFSLFAVAHESGSFSKLVESPGSSTTGTWVDRGNITGDVTTDLFAF